MMALAVGDIRTAARGAWLFERIVSLGSLVLRHLGGTRAGEVAVGRFLSSPHVTVEGIVGGLSQRTGAACAGRRVVAAQDTTEIDFAGRAARRRGLGPAGDGETPGFFIHPLVAVDADDEAVLGLVHARIWSRGSERVPPRAERAFDDKESARWLEAAEAAAEHLSGAAQVVVVGDQESDIWDCFARRPAAIDVLVRARHDRPLAGGGSLHAAPLDWPASPPTAVRVAPRGPGDKGRIAQVVVRFGTVEIRRPARAARQDPESLRLTLVEAREVHPPAGVEPLLWRLLTSLPADSHEDAAEVVRLYRLRWRIEQVFRSLKRDGLALEETQLQDAGHLLRLAALAIGAAVRIIQLVDARDGSPRPMNDVLDQSLLEPVAAIGQTRQGKTPRQQNPHPEGSLAWLSWIVARFGGWNCYYKPPGPKTMAIGWQRFAATLSGFLIAVHEAHP